jgi:transposase
LYGATRRNNTGARKAGGRKPKAARLFFEAIVYVLRTWRPVIGRRMRGEAHGVKSLPEVLEATVTIRPPVTEEAPQNLCADAACTGKTAKHRIQERDYIPHVRARGEEIEAKARNPNHKVRRWVVEACHCWFNRFCKRLVRYEKTDRSYMALVMIACSIIALRRVSGEMNIIYG